MAEMCSLQSIPQPPKYLFGLLGNIPDIDITAKSTSYSRLAAEYGPIFKLDLVSKDLTILSSHELINEVFDETRFEKLLGTLREVRHAAGDGLITALTHEPVSLSPIMETRNLVLTAVELETRSQALVGSPGAHGHPRNVPQDAGHSISIDPEMGSPWVGCDP